MGLARRSSAACMGFAVGISVCVSAQLNDIRLDIEPYLSSESDGPSEAHMMWEAARAVASGDALVDFVPADRLALRKVATVRHGDTARGFDAIEATMDELCSATPHDLIQQARLMVEVHEKERAAFEEQVTQLLSTLTPNGQALIASGMRGGESSTSRRVTRMDWVALATGNPELFQVFVSTTCQNYVKLKDRMSAVAEARALFFAGEKDTTEGATAR